MTLEQALIEHCSPTLVGLKPASLFRFQPADTREFVRAFLSSAPNWRAPACGW